MMPRWSTEYIREFGDGADERPARSGVGDATDVEFLFRRSEELRRRLVQRGQKVVLDRSQACHLRGFATSQVFNFSFYKKIGLCGRV